MDGIKTISIGDIHGEDYWRTIADIEELLNSDGTLTPKYDKYIFVGDYVDSFWVNDFMIISNLKNIIKFKTLYPDNVVLLIGNHDVQYIREKSWIYRCSGFRQIMYERLHKIYKDNITKFRLAFGYGNTLWTHAGVHNEWFEKAGLKCTNGNAEEMAEQLNTMWDENNPDIYDVGYLRGGMNDVGGPLWVDKAKLYRDPIKRFNQIVGHTNVKVIETYNINGIILYFIDASTRTSPYDPIGSNRLPRALIRYINK